MATALDWYGDWYGRATVGLRTAGLTIFLDAGEIFTGPSSA